MIALYAPSEADRGIIPGILAEAYRDGHFIGQDSLLAFALMDSWLRDEYPNLALDSSTWAEMFDQVGFIDNLAPAERPVSLPTLYRASVPGQELGMSWADNRGKAEYFHERHRHLGWASVLLMLDSTDPTIAVAHHHGPDWRDEYEWVLDLRSVDAACLTILDRIDGDPPPTG